MNAARDLDHGVGAPSTASIAPGERLVTEIDRDEFGNPFRIRGPVGPQRPCAEYVMDLAYKQFIAKVDTDAGPTGDCVGPMLTQNLVLDRGSAQLRMIQDPQRETLTAYEYDPFGRLVEVYGPHSEVPYEPQLLLRLDHGDHSPVPYVTIERRLYEYGTDDGSALLSIEILNGLGEHVVGFDERPLQSGTQWVARDRTERDGDGRVRAVTRPFFYTGDPSSVPWTLPAIAPQATGIVANHDAFGRTRSVFDNGVKIAEHRYLPLLIESRDAEQVTSGPHAGNFTTVHFDGHGRAV